MCNRYFKVGENYFYTSTECSVCQILNKYTSIRYMLRVNACKGELWFENCEFTSDPRNPYYYEFAAIADRLYK